MPGDPGTIRTRDVGHIEMGWVDDGPDLWAVALAAAVAVAGPLIAFLWP